MGEVVTEAHSPEVGQGGKRRMGSMTLFRSAGVTSDLVPWDS